MQFFLLHTKSYLRAHKVNIYKVTKLNLQLTNCDLQVQNIYNWNLSPEIQNNWDVFHLQYQTVTLLSACPFGDVEQQ